MCYFLRNHRMNAKIHHYSIRLYVLGRTTQAPLSSFTFVAFYSRRLWFGPLPHSSFFRFAGDHFALLPFYSKPQCRLVSSPSIVSDLYGPYPGLCPFLFQRRKFTQNMTRRSFFFCTAFLASGYENFDYCLWTWREIYSVMLLLSSQGVNSTHFRCTKKS